MSDGFMEALMNEKVRVPWYTQDELEQLADAVDDMMGEKLGRRYMRGYTNIQYPYWGIAPGWGDESRYQYVLFGYADEHTYTFEEFMSLLSAESPENNSPIDVSDLI